MKTKHVALIIGIAVANVLAHPAIATQQSRADELVTQLRDLPTPLPDSPPGNGKMPPIELRRNELYREIRQLGTNALPALESGLRDNDVRLRRSVAIVFNALAGGWMQELRPRLNIQRSLPVLIEALGDTDFYVRAWSAGDWLPSPPIITVQQAQSAQTGTARRWKCCCTNSEQ